MCEFWFGCDLSSVALVCGVSVKGEREPFMALNVFVRLMALSKLARVVPNHACLVTGWFAGAQT